jgi:hypothetical protein
MKKYNKIILFAILIVFSASSVGIYANSNIDIVYRDDSRWITNSNIEIVYQDGSRIIARTETADGLKYAIIDEAGNNITPFIYDSLSAEHNLSADLVQAIIGNPWIGMSVGQGGGGNFGFLNWDGSVKLPIEYIAMYFSGDALDRFTVVHRQGGHGLINSNGEIIIPAIYRMLGYNSAEGIVTILNDEGIFAFADRDGTFLTDFIFDSVVPANEGFFAVSIGGLWGFVYKDMNMVFPPEFVLSANFEFGYAHVQRQDGTAVRLEHPLKSSRDINIYLNGRWIYTDQEPVIKDDRTLVPVRHITEALGYFVSWDGNTQSIDIRDGERTIIMQIGNRQATVDGEIITLDVAPQIIGNRTFIPIRFVAEATGAEVTWDSVTRTVNIDF